MSFFCFSFKKATNVELYTLDSCPYLIAKMKNVVRWTRHPFIFVCVWDFLEIEFSVAYAFFRFCMC